MDINFEVQAVVMVLRPVRKGSLEKGTGVIVRNDRGMETRVKYKRFRV
ncbi:hypothetical protein [Asticcacaulis sp. MM231]